MTARVALASSDLSALASQVTLVSIPPGKTLPASSYHVHPQFLASLSISGVQAVLVSVLGRDATAKPLRWEVGVDVAFEIGWPCTAPFRNPVRTLWALAVIGCGCHRRHNDSILVVESACM